MDIRATSENLRFLLQAVCAQHGFTVEAVLAHDNRREVVAVRRQFAQEARAKGFSFPAIGAALGRHHSTVISLLKGSQP